MKRIWLWGFVLMCSVASADVIYITPDGSFIPFQQAVTAAEQKVRQAQQQVDEAQYQCERMTKDAQDALEKANADLVKAQSALEVDTVPYGN